MLKVIPAFATIALVFALAACGGDDDDPAGSGSPSASAGAESLEGQLASILLKDTDVPVGLQGAGLTYSTNEKLAGPDQEELDRLNFLGRQLGADLTFVPTGDLPDEAPVRGGIQNSASVYSNTDGASITFRETKEEAQSNDWAASYPELTDLRIYEIDRMIGDESLWIRVTGLETCAVQTPVGEVPTGPVATFACPFGSLVVDDYLIFRAGRTRSLVKVLSAHPALSLDDVYADQVQGWANLVVERALATFGPAGS